MSDLPAVWYIAICQGKKILCDIVYSNQQGGNFKNVAIQLIKKIKPPFRNDKTYKPFKFFIDADDHFSILIITDDEYKKSVGYTLLMKVKSVWYSQSDSEVLNCANLNSATHQELQKLIQSYNSVDCDKLIKTHKLIDETKELLLDNQKLLDVRGDKLQGLVNKSQVMVDLSTQLKKSAKNLKNQMWWRNNKMWFIIGGVGTVTVYMGLVFVCGSFAACF